MTTKTRILTRTLLVCAVLTCFATTTYAQAGAKGSISGFVSLNGGLQRPAVSTQTSEVSVRDSVGTTAFAVDYRLADAMAFDVGGGVLFRRRFSVGANVSRYSDSQPGTGTLTFDHPFYHPTISASLDSGDLKRTETGLHVQVGYRVPVGGRLELLVFGGPSRSSLTQDVIVDLDGGEYFVGSPRRWTASLRNFETERLNGSAWGYNAGTDLGVKLAERVSVGALVRYSRATVSIEDPVATAVKGRTVSMDLDAGGLQVMGGMRLRF